jgi:hypothetical protein
VTVDVKCAVDGIRHQLPKRVTEVTTLTNAYIGSDDERKAVFVSTLSVDKDDIDQQKWEDLGQKLRHRACADHLFKDSIQHGHVRLLYRYINKYGQTIGEFLVNNC